MLDAGALPEVLCEVFGSRWTVGREEAVEWRNVVEHGIRPPADETPNAANR
jgi:hypothetical protein